MKPTRAAKYMEFAASRSPQYVVKELANLCVHEARHTFQESSLFQKALFLKEFCKKPRAMGAICPSSRHLALSMAEHIPSDAGLVVELGAGTGTVTQAIAKALDHPQKSLWAVEQSGELAARLAQKLPSVRVVQGDARELTQFLPQGRPVDVIVSCLPLRSFAAKDVEAVTRQWHTLLAPNGFVVQFTYVLWRPDRLLPYGFYEAAHRIVWKNIPPARVQILKKVAKGDGLLR